MELLERGSYLADLTAWFAAVDERGGCIALVRGEAGIGKTFLLNEFSRQQRETRVLWGACDALFTPRPLAPLHDVARQAQGPLLAAINSGANRDKIFAAMLDELERTKTLVVFEDLHWADEATLDLLKYLGRRIQRSRAMLVVTYRDDEVDPRHPLRSVIGDLPRPSTHRMSLSPLSEPAVAILATRAGRPSGGLHGVTGGNPLFVTEILAAVAGAVPSTVRDAVLARVGRLGPAALAGYGMGSRLDYLLIPILFGLGSAVLTMVGTCVGARDIRRAKRVALAGTVIGAGFAELVGLVVGLFPAVWVGLFTREAPVLQAGSTYLHAVAPFYAAVGTTFILGFASQGAARPLLPFLAGTVRLLIAAGIGTIAVHDWGADMFGLSVIVACASLASAIICLLAAWLGLIWAPLLP